MKRIFFILLFFSSVSLCAQEVPEPLAYSEVVLVENASADELFSRGRAWFATAFKDAKSVLQMAENDKLIGKAAEVFDVYGGFTLGNFTVRVSYDISIECRDGRYKYIIDNVVANSRCGWADFGALTTAENYKEKGGGAKTYNKIWHDVKGKFDAYQLVLVMSLKSAMLKSGLSEIGNDDW